MGSKIFWIVGIVVLILVAGGTVFFLMNALSAPDLPPASTSTSTTTTTNTGTTTDTSTTGTGTTGAGTNTGTGTTTNTDTGTNTGTGSSVSDFIDTSSDVATGVITNICGVTGDENGIDVDADGTCGRCTNLEGTDGSCEPAAGEIVAVIGCDTRSGIQCEIVDDEGVVLETDLDTLVYASDYSDQACTIQLNVYNEGTDPEDEDATPLDYLVFQNDECDTDTDPGTGTDVQCGDACIADSECPTGNVCSASGTCVIAECNSDPTQCMTGDLCTIAEETDNDTTDTPTVEEEGTAQCGETCAESADCTDGNLCVDAKCIASFCAEGNCDDGCTLPETALINDDVDRVLIGIAILVIGILAIKTNFHVKLFYAFGGRFVTAQFSTEEQERLNQEMAAYEEYKKSEDLKKAKESREEFEEKFK